MTAILRGNARQKWSKLEPAHEDAPQDQPTALRIGSAAREHQHPHCFILHVRTLSSAGVSCVLLAVAEVLIPGRHCRQ